MRMIQSSVLLLAIATQSQAGPATLGVLVSWAGGAGAESRVQAHGAENVIGEVIEIDSQARTAKVKTDQGMTLLIKAEDNTRCLRVPAGETTLEKATPIQFGEIGGGDRVLARGQMSQDKKQMQAARLIVLPRADVDKKRQHDLDEWRRRGLAAVVTAVNAQAGEISVEARGPGRSERITLVTAGCVFRRYAPGSIRFSDAKPSSLGELRVGDQLRVLGDRSADGKFKAEEIVAGSFKTLGALVTDVNPQKREIKASTLDQKTSFVISIGRDSALHRIPPQMAAAIAQMLLGSASSSTGAAQRPGGFNTTPESTGRAAAPAPGAAPAPERSDIQQMIDGLPSLTLADIKAGDVVAVTFAADRDDEHITAIKLVAGVDGVLNAIKPAPGKRQTIPLSAGLPAGFDFSAVQP